MLATAFTKPLHKGLAVTGFFSDSNIYPHAYGVYDLLCACCET